ncbi:MAG: argininosuccinate lyase [bacterium]|nr:argininosuccinate lyase [bacterium]
MTQALWTANGLDASVAKYTIGDDLDWDDRLLTWDLLGSIAHVEGLRAADLLIPEDADQLVAVLRRALRAAQRGEFVIPADAEDVHTAVETWLTEELGSVGEKVHCGRSRNDQVLVDVRLYTKDRLLELMDGIVLLAGELLRFAGDHASVLLPGYTHQRRAMPSSVGLWAAGFAESLLDDLETLKSALDLTDRSPLGSAAGYGVPLPLDRELVADILGFKAVQRNVTAVQSARGKLEATVLAALWGVGYDLGKIAWDLILFSSEEFGFFELPIQLTTGSSIMPQKRNPDILELTRARSGVLEGLMVEAMAVAGRLPSGYHRDLQLVKGPLMRGLDLTGEMVAMMRHLVPRLRVNAAVCERAVSGGLLATDEVLGKVTRGESFRSAYRDVAARVREGEDPPSIPTKEIIASRSHTGGIGNLGLDESAQLAAQWGQRIQVRRERFNAAIARIEGSNT